jgi:hypothetical protein
MGFMVISHHISTALAAERQRDLRPAARRGRRFSFSFRRRAAELDPVQPVVTAATGADAQGGSEAPADRFRRRIEHAPARHGAPAAAHVGAGCRDRAVA